jgi:hypothetical protein
VLELQRLTRRYGDLVALDGLSFTVAEAGVRVCRLQRADKATSMRRHPGHARTRGRPSPTAQTPMRTGCPNAPDTRPRTHGQTFLPSAQAILS